MAGLVASAILFAVVRSFANPAPKTMTQEWQEKTNEFLIVRAPGYSYYYSDSLADRILFVTNRPRSPTLSRVSRQKVTPARATSSLLLRGSRRAAAMVVSLVRQ